MPLQSPQSYKFKFFYSSRNPIAMDVPLLIGDYNGAFFSHNPFTSSFPLFSFGTFDLINLDNDDVMFFRKSVTPLEEGWPNAHLLEKGLHTIKSKLGIKKWNYDTTIKFQDSWVVKLPWTKLCVRSNCSLHTVKCRICNEVERKDKVLFVK